MRTDREIVKETEKLADAFARINGIHVKTPNYSYRNSDNNQLRPYWYMACEAQRFFTETDPNDCEDESEVDIILSETLAQFEKIATEAGVELSEVFSYRNQQNVL